MKDKILTWTAIFLIFIFLIHQGYVTELILTLEAVVDALDSDIRPMDLNKEIFKSTPNLKDAASAANTTTGKQGPV